MNISYVENIEGIDYKQLNAMLEKNTTKKAVRGVSHTQTVFENSQYFVFAYNLNQLIGVIRAISDGEWAVIYDFVVIKEHETSEIKEEILSRLVKQLVGQHIFTNTTSETLSFFEENGFQRTKTAFTYVGFEQGAKKYSKNYFLPQGYQFENEFFEVKLPFAKRHVPTKKKKVTISYRTSRSGVDYKRVNEIINRAFKDEDSWRSENINITEIEKTRHLFDISQYVSFAYDGDRLVGVARAITDKLEEAYIQNIAVDPDYQGYGIGWQVTVTLCEAILKDGLNPFLHTHPGAVGFYNRLGFLRNKFAVDYRGQEDKNRQVPIEIEQGFYLPSGYRFIDEF